MGQGRGREGKGAGERGCVRRRGGARQRGNTGGEGLTSVRPAICSAKSAHLLPWLCCSVMISVSSSGDQAVRLMDGSRWLYHRSRHCEWGRGEETVGKKWLR